MIEKLLKLASYYDKSLQFKKADNINEIIKSYAEGMTTDVIDVDEKLPFARTVQQTDIDDVTTIPKLKSVLPEETKDEEKDEWNEQAEQEKEYFGPGFKLFYEKLASGESLPSATKHLRLLGSGSFRMVFDLGDLVLKVAKTSPSDKFHPPKKMNTLEADYDMASRFPEFVAKTYAHAKDFTWLVQDKVIIMKTSHWFLSFFPELKGIPASDKYDHKDVFKSYIYVVAEKYGLGNIPNLERYLTSRDKIKESNNPGYKKEKLNELGNLITSLKKINVSDLMERFVRFIYAFSIQVDDVREHNVGYISTSDGVKLILPDISRNINKSSNYINYLKKKADYYDKKLNFGLADKYTKLIPSYITKEAQLSTLEPEFKAQVSSIMSELSQLGWKPRVASGRRSIKSQIGKFQKGYSVIFGTGAHYLGLAADVIDKRYGWKVKGNHKFFQDLGRIAQSHGLTWGGKWKSSYPPYGDVAHIQATDQMIRKYQKDKKIAILQDSMAGLGISVNKTGIHDEQTKRAWDELRNILTRESQGKINLPELSPKTSKMGAKYAQYLTMMKQIKLNKRTKKNLKRMSLMFGKDVRHLWKNPEMNEALRKNEQIYEIQELMKNKGIYRGKLDGAWGKKTSEAWQKFAKKYPSPETDRMQKEIERIFA